MIKLFDLVKGSFRDPFTGELSEGLIRTVEVDKALDIVEKQFPTFDSFYEGESNNSIRIEFSPKYLKSPEQNYIGDLPDPNISKVLSLLNNLGYFPSVVQYDLGSTSGQIKYSSSQLRDLVINKRPKYLSFIFEPKYDPVVEPPKYIYHITDRKYLDSIKKIGLKPKTLNKLSAHESRIYFSVSEEAAQKLWNRLKWYIPQDRGVLLTVDTESLGITFYNDPNFDKLGIYTYANISPQHITSYEPLQES